MSLAVPPRWVGFYADRLLTPERRQRAETSV